MFWFSRHLRINPVLIIDGGSEQTATHIASQLYAWAASGGAGASNDAKRMIAGANFMQLSC